MSLYVCIDLQQLFCPACYVMLWLVVLSVHAGVLVACIESGVSVISRDA